MKTTETTSKNSTPSAPKSKTDKPSEKAISAITLLSNDHRKVEALFEEYEKAKASSRKQKIALEICDELTVHAAVEEKGFYPPAREALGKDADLVDEADVEHASLKWLIAQIKAESPDSDHYDAKVKVLSEYVSHHVKEEEKEIFPKIKKSDLDMEALGAKLLELKTQLTPTLTHH